ncbi:MAG: 30S ribosomal protein S6 [Candidatus Omnitrophota bacterium]|nr:MAG: 30S ribosomal protein S6 [Candidatus Omnitrophota bacterium]
MERVYESMMILKANLDDKENEEIFQKIIKRVEGLKGKVSSSKVWVKERTFFYPLRGRGAEKKRHFKGCYWLIDFKLDTAKLGDLKETIRLEERILRNLIIKKEEKAVKEKIR